jgi:hypothetical protein
VSFPTGESWLQNTRSWQNLLDSQVIPLKASSFSAQNVSDSETEAFHGVNTAHNAAEDGVSTGAAGAYLLGQPCGRYGFLFARSLRTAQISPNWSSAISQNSIFTSKLHPVRRNTWFEPLNILHIFVLLYILCTKFAYLVALVGATG